MKISNQQIDSLVSAILSKNREDRDNEIKLLKSDKKIIELARKYTSYLNKIPKEIRSSCYIDKDESRFINALAESKKLKTKTLSFDTVKNSIIIASIEVTSLDELKKKLKFDF